MDSNLQEIALQLGELITLKPISAIKLAKTLDLSDCYQANLCAATLIDAGALINDKRAINEGISILEKLLIQDDSDQLKYNLANGIAALIEPLSKDVSWLCHKESTREDRNKIRQLYWDVGSNIDNSFELRTQAFTNLANQLSSSYRISEAHDIRLDALRVDPKNAVAAGIAAQELITLYYAGIGSELVMLEASHLAGIARDNSEKLYRYTHNQNAETLINLISKIPSNSVPPRRLDPFLAWVERERLTLSPTVELIDPSLEKIDWLNLFQITEKFEKDNHKNSTVPSIFAMFNTLKSDFVMARHIAWMVASEEEWPRTGSYADTLDYAIYGAETSAITLAHNTAINILDKTAVLANHYFSLGLDPDKVDFRRIWRVKDKQSKKYELTNKVKEIVESFAPALYGLVELSDDYVASRAAQEKQKYMRDAATHRFVVLHDIGVSWNRYNQKELEHYDKNEYIQKTLAGLRFARSAIQMLALAIAQKEKHLLQQDRSICLEMDVLDYNEGGSF